MVIQDLYLHGKSIRYSLWKKQITKTACIVKSHLTQTHECSRMFWQINKQNKTKLKQSLIRKCIGFYRRKFRGRVGFHGSISIIKALTFSMLFSPFSVWSSS